MTSPFLTDGDTDLSVLQDGSFTINVAGATVSDSIPGMPLRTDSRRKVTSGLIQLADCAFTPMTNPAAANLNMGGHAVTNAGETQLNENAAPTAPPTNGLTLFTHADKFQYVDDTSTIYQVATATDLASYLPIAGGGMVGSINMGGYDLSVVNQISGSVNSRSADDIISSSGTATAGRVATFSSDKVIQDGGTLLSALATAASVAGCLPKAGGTMAGDINMGTNNITNITAIRPVDSNVNIGSSTSQALGGVGNVTLNDFASTTGNYGFAAGVLATAKNNAIAIGRGAVAQDNATVVGYQSSVSATRTDSIVIGHDNTSANTSADIFGVNRTNSTASSLLLGNGSYVNIRANNTCDLGTAAVPFQSVYLGGSIAGATNSRTADNIVSNTGTGTAGRVVTFVSDKVIQDGGTLLSDLATTAAMATADNLRLLKAGDTMSGALAMATNNITNVGSISGAANTRTADNIVSNVGTSVSGNIASLSGTTGKVITDSGVVAASVVVGPASAISGNVATYSGITGKLVADEGTALSALATTSATNTALALKLALAGGTMSGALAMGASDITNVGSLSGATNTRSADNILSCSTAQTTGNLLMFTAGAKVAQDSSIIAANVVTGPASAVANNVSVFSGTTGKLITNAAAGIGTIGALTLANTTASTTTGTGAFICPGGAGIAGALNVGGVIKTTDATASTSATTGSIVTAGGIGSSGNCYFAGLVNLTNTNTTVALNMSGGMTVGGFIQAISLITAAGGITVSAGLLTSQKSVVTNFPSCFWGAATGPFGQSYIANTATLVATATLTETSDPMTEFTPTAATGQVVYTGVSTRYFRVSINFSILGQATASSYKFGVSKNGSTTFVNARNVNWTTATPAGYAPYECEAVYSLATNDTIQLLGQYSATLTINMIDIEVMITPIT